MTNVSTAAPVGVIGLGSMGMGTALALRDAGLDLIGCDVSTEARQHFVGAGGRVAESPAEVARECAVVLIVVVNSQQVDEVLFGADGVVSTMREGGLVIQCATVAPSYVRGLGERLAECGLGLLDAPISGGAVKAREGRLSVMASGNQAYFVQAAAVLDGMAEKVYRLGDAPGAGSASSWLTSFLPGCISPPPQKRWR